MSKVYQRAAARRDLVDHYLYLAENAGREIADRFLSETERSFQYLANRPRIGTPLKPHNARLAGMRKWRVKNFERFLIFYLLRHDGSSIVRVLHTAQDWWGLLGINKE